MNSHLNLDWLLSTSPCGNSGGACSTWVLANDRWFFVWKSQSRCFSYVVGHALRSFEMTAPWCFTFYSTLILIRLIFISFSHVGC
jgi:hypothetical protein